MVTKYSLYMKVQKVYLLQQSQILGNPMYKSLYSPNASNQNGSPYLAINHYGILVLHLQQNVLLCLEQPVNIAGDMNSNLGNREQQGRATTGDMNSGLVDNRQHGGPSMVALGVGVPCGIIGLIILVAISICIGWLIRHVQPQIHYKKKYPENGHMPDNTNNPSGFQVQTNITCQQQLDKSESRRINCGNADLSIQAHVRSHNEAHCQIECEGEEIEMTSHNVAYQLEANQTRNVDAHSAMPPSHKLPPLPLHEIIPDEEEQLYEYIL